MDSGGKNEGPTTTKGERRKWIGGREGEGRKEEGICRTNIKLLPTTLLTETLYTPCRYLLSLTLVRNIFPSNSAMTNCQNMLKIGNEISELCQFVWN